MGWDWTDSKMRGYDPQTGMWYPVIVDHAGHLISHTISELKIHDGLLFAGGYYDSSVADNGDIELLIDVPSTTEVVASMFVRVGGDAVLTVFEGTTVSANGTTITPTNLNRSSANSPSVNMYHTPTVTGDGTQIFESYSPGGSLGFSAGGEGALETGFFAANTKYLCRLTNISGVANPLQLTIRFYEHSV